MPYTNPHYLVETDWLAQHLRDPNLRIFNVTGMLTSKLGNIAKERCYDQGHIPGAVFLDVASAKGVLSDPSAQLPWMWPPMASRGTKKVARRAGRKAQRSMRRTRKPTQRLACSRVFRFS